MTRRRRIARLEASPPQPVVDPMNAAVLAGMPLAEMSEDQRAAAMQFFLGFYDREEALSTVAAFLDDQSRDELPQIGNLSSAESHESASPYRGHPSPSEHPCGP
jgi:hypothetical protein